MLQRCLGIAVVNGLPQGFELLEGLADRVIGVAPFFVEPQTRLARVGHALGQQGQRLGDLPAVGVAVQDLVHPIAESRGAFLGLVEGLSGSDRVGSEDLPGLGGLGSNAVDLGFVGDGGKSLLLNLLDAALDFLLPDDHDLGRRPGILVGLVELVHAGRALLGFGLDLLEDLGIGNELLGFFELFGPQGRVFLGQRLGLVERVHDLQPAIPEPGEVAFDFLIERERLAADRLLEVGIVRRQFLEPRFERIEPVHDVDRALLVLLDLRLHRVAGPAAGQPYQTGHDQADRQQRGQQGQKHLVLNACRARCLLLRRDGDSCRRHRDVRGGWGRGDQRIFPRRR